MKKYLLFIIFITFSSAQLFSMCAPAGYASTADAICNAPTVTQDGACVSGTNVGLTVCLSGGCFAALNQDFMQFTATSTAVIIDFTSTGISTADLGVLTNGAGGCGDHVSVCPAIGGLCIESCNTSSGTGPLSVNPTNLIIGETYYLMVESSSANAGTFDICVSTDPCRNGIQDGSETGVDCGGSCSPCAATNDACSDNISMTLDVTNAVGSGASNTCTQALCTDPNTEDCFIQTGPGCNPGCCLVSYMSCGSVENNTWYTFTPAVTDSFHFALTNQICSNGDGMQLWLGTIPGDACNSDASTYNEIYCQSTATTADINHTEYLTAGQTYFITLDGFAGDDCSFDFGVYSTNILPIELLYFNARHASGDVILEWVTESEKNNDYFTVERSKDGKSFEVLEVISGAGNSNATKKYNKKDLNLSPGIYHYRLNQTDYDGSSKFVGESIVRVSELSNFVLSPSVTTTDTKIDMFLNSPNYTHIFVLDMSGAVVFDEKIELSKGASSFSIPSSNFAQGSYLVNIETMSGVETLRLVKQ